MLAKNLQVSRRQLHNQDSKDFAKDGFLMVAGFLTGILQIVIVVLLHLKATILGDF